MIVVVAAVVMVLGLVYGLGYLCFAWWDGGLWLRLLIGFGAVAVIWALLTHPEALDFRF